MDPGIAKLVGAGLLAEVEEESLEMILASLQQQQQQAKLSTSTEETPSPSQSHSDSNRNTNNITIHPKLLALPPGLRDLVIRHQRATTTTTSTAQQQPQQTPILSITGRYLPLLYHLISTLIAAPHRYAVVVIDPEWRFDVTRLLPVTPSSFSTTTTATPNPCPATSSDLRHVHVLRPPRTTGAAGGGGGVGGGLRAALNAAREWMLYAPAPRNPSRGREWWGTVVVGSGGGGGGGGGSLTSSGDAELGLGGGAGGMLVTSGWKGWLRVDREEVAGFAGAGGAGVGSCSAEEALAQRERRREVVERARWVAACRWGGYAWRE